MDFKKSFVVLELAYLSGQVSGDVIKKARGGVYRDNPINRKLGRVGLRYGHSTLEKFYKTQAKLHEDFTEYVNDVIRDTGGEMVIAPLKSFKRVTEKVEEDYGGDFRKVKDVLRSTAVFESVEECERFYEKFFKEQEVTKAHIDFKTEGYQGANIVVVYKGYNVEVQVNTALNMALKDNFNSPMIQRAEEILREAGVRPNMGHKYYEVFRKAKSKDLKVYSDKLMTRYYEQRRKFL